MRQISKLLSTIACIVAAASSPALMATETLEGDGPNPALFRKDASPFGVDMPTWAERLTQWVYRQPAEHNPVLDQTGADCGVDQSGPVWFIPPIEGPPVFVGTRHCDIPLGKAILLDIGNYVALYPRPTRPTYQPAVGETLSHFLTGKADGVMDSVNHLEVSLDGRPMSDVLSYRFVSDGLFELTGDPSLADVYDPRILGWGMPGISDGFFMMFKPLSAGTHTLRVYGTNTFGDDKTYIYYLNVR